MYHYLECGLPKIWLENGYQLHETPYGESLAIDDLAGLHQAIGRSLARKPKLTGAELRFMRKEMGLSQKRLAEMLGSSEQTVALWERKGKISPIADRMTRLIYLEQIDGQAKIAEIIDRLCAMDQIEHEERLVLSASQDYGWNPLAA
jgi:DNA-binding transcriptional regulator YiaG